VFHGVIQNITLAQFFLRHGVDRVCCPVQVFRMWMWIMFAVLCRCLECGSCLLSYAGVWNVDRVCCPMQVFGMWIVFAVLSRCLECGSCLLSYAGVWNVDHCPMQVFGMWIVFAVLSRCLECGSCLLLECGSCLLSYTGVWNVDHALRGGRPWWTTTACTPVNVPILVTSVVRRLHTMADCGLILGYIWGPAETLLAEPVQHVHNVLSVVNTGNTSVRFVFIPSCCFDLDKREGYQNCSIAVRQ